MSTEVATISQPQTYRDYAPEYKAEVLAQVAANGGNVFRTAQETGIHHATIQYWLASAARYAGIQQQKQLDLATKYECNLHRLTDSVAEHDLESATLQAKATAIGILTEKMLLLRGQPTSINLNVNRDDLFSLLQQSLEDID